MRYVGRPFTAISVGPIIARLGQDVQIARVANVSIEWLATGEGIMRPDRNASLITIDIDTIKLKTVLVAVKMIIQENGLHLTPLQEAEIVSGLYGIVQTDKIIPRSAILHFIKAAQNNAE